MKMISAAALAGAALLAAPASAAVLVQYNFGDNTGVTATEAPTNVAAGLAGLTFQRGPGLTAASATGGFNSSGFANPQAAADYLSFGLTVQTGFTASVNQLTFGAQASGTGPSLINVLANVDNGGFVTIGSFANASTNAANVTINFAALTATSRLEFRLTPGNGTSVNGVTQGNGTATAEGGTFRVQNTGYTSAASPGTAFSVNGDVNTVTAAVPETATWAMMIVGFGAAGASLRRRRAVFAVA